MTSFCRGVRGATTADSNSREGILQATPPLIALMLRKNGIDSADVASALFTTTKDVDAVFPALAARQLGWLDVPLICTHEIDVPNALPLCIRILIHWNTAKSQSEIDHIYVKDAVALRPDLSERLGKADMDELEKWIEDYMRENDPS